MENPQTETATIPVEVQVEIPVVEAPAPVILESTTFIEQNPEANTRWQNDISSLISMQHQKMLEQSAQVITIVQQFRESLTAVQECQLRIEAALVQLSQKPQSEPPIVPVVETLEIAPVVNPESQTEPPEVPETQREKKTRKGLRKI